jgi:uncharacterized protein YoxC
MIVIINKKLREYLVEKDEIVKKARKISVELEVVDKTLEEMKTEQRKFTEECIPSELIAKGDALKDKINKEIEELEKIGKEIQDVKVAAIPKEKVKAYEEMKKTKEGMEQDRAKLALKVQKIKDRVAPIIHKEMKPHLGEYDDIETATLKGEKILVETFNYLEEWKAKFKEQNKK